jgi:hypothetical protein
MKARTIRDAVAPAADNIVFLDLDGVLIPYDKHSQKIHEYFDDYYKWSARAIKMLNELVRKHNAKVVVTSSYRKKYNKEELTDRLQLEGFRYPVMDCTEVIRGVRRKGEIKRWLDEHEVRSFVIFDDNENHDIFDYYPDNFVECDHNVGITEADYRKADTILSTNV